MPELRPPLHEHICLICKGDYPCWKVDCTLRREFICDDCAEGKVGMTLSPSPNVN